MPSPLVTIVALIYKSPSYARDFYRELLESTPELKSGLAEFFYVANNANAQTLKELAKRKIAFLEFNRPQLSIQEHMETQYAAPEYIGRVYAAYNYGVERSTTEFVVLLNSDMVMSPGWLSKMLACYESDELLSPKLIERNHPNFGVFPGAVEKNFGSNFYNFKRAEWKEFCDSFSKTTSLKNIGGPFMPVMISRQIFLKFGGFPEGNLRGDNYFDISEYGDQYFFRKLHENAFRHKSLENVFCYHFKEGEKNSSFVSRVKFEFVPYLKNKIRFTRKFFGF